MISQKRSKERRKRQIELQQQERLLKLQKLKEPGVPIADFASEIVEIESLNTSEAEQVQEETVDLQPDEQVTHDCYTQTEAFDHLYQSVASPSVKDGPRADASTQTEKFHYLFTHSSTSKPFKQNYFRDDNAKVSFYTGLPTYEVLEATFILKNTALMKTSFKSEICFLTLSPLITLPFSHLCNFLNYCASFRSVSLSLVSGCTE